MNALFIYIGYIILIIICIYTHIYIYIIYDANDRAEPISVEDSAREDDDNNSNSENEMIDIENTVYNNIDSEPEKKKKRNRYGKNEWDMTLR